MSKSPIFLKVCRRSNLNPKRMKLKCRYKQMEAILVTQTVYRGRFDNKKSTGTLEDIFSNCTKN